MCRDGNWIEFDGSFLFSDIQFTCTLRARRIPHIGISTSKADIADQRSKQRLRWTRWEHTFSTSFIYKSSLECISFSFFFSWADAFGIRLTHDYVPGTDGQYQGCVVSKVFHGSRADFHGEIYEGDEVKEINGIKMAQKSDFEIKQILNGIRGEADLICRRQELTLKKISFAYMFYNLNLQFHWSFWDSSRDSSPRPNHGRGPIRQSYSWRSISSNEWSPEDSRDPQNPSQERTSTFIVTYPDG